MEHAIIHGFTETAGAVMATHMAHLAGGSVHGVIAAAGASVQTAKSRKKEKAFGKSGGLKGFSRTKANKDVTETWSGAVVGTGASIGGGMAAYAAGAVVGQVSRADHLIQLYCFVNIKNVHLLPICTYDISINI